MSEETPVTPNETVVEKVRARAAKAVTEGVTDARAAVGEALPAVGDALAKALYGGCYYAAYYVTFTALALARMIPEDSPVAQGLHDGAEAATQDYRAHKAQQARVAAAAVGGGEAQPGG